MKTLKDTFKNRINTIKNFPITHIILLFATIYGIIKTTNNSLFTDTIAPVIFTACFIGFLVSLIQPIIKLHGNKLQKSNKMLNIIFCILPVLTIIGGYFFLKTFNIKYYADRLSFFALPIATIIGIFFLIAQIYKKNENAIRISRKNIIFSIIFGGSIGLIVWGGLSGAIASINTLFNMKIDYKRYQYIGFISMIFIVGSSILDHYIFLSKIQIEKKHEIKNLNIRNIFGKYIFLPLIFIYLIIFIVYAIKILITKVRPKGIIVNLGFGFFTIGILTYYLIFPEKTKKIEIIKKILFLSFMFIATIMVLALLKRVNQYGFSINRCLVLSSIIFIYIFSIFSLFTKNNRLTGLSGLLFLFIIISIYGPINIKKITISSQKIRLESALIKENIYFPLQANSFSNFSGDDNKTIIESIEILKDLCKNFQFSKWNKGIIASDFAYTETGSYISTQKQEILKYLGAERGNYTKRQKSIFQNFERDNTYDSVDINGFRQLYQIYDTNINNNIISYKYGSGISDILNLSDYIGEISQLNKEKKTHFSISKGNKKYVFTHIYGEIDTESNDLTITYSKFFLLEQ